MKNNDKKETNLHSGHRDRLRTTTQTIGFENLPEHQKLELLLSFVIPRKDTNPLAHTLIDEFGSFANVLDADAHSLMQIKGIGSVVTNFLNVCGKIPYAYKKSKLAQKTVLSCPSQIIKYFADVATTTSTEIFYLICLNAKSEVIKTTAIGGNGVDKVAVDFRDIIHETLKHNSKGVIICHTHPDGLAKPSQADIIFTKQLFFTLSIIGIKLCDHIIFAPNENFSFFNEGLIQEFSNEFSANNSTIASVLKSNEIVFTKDKPTANK